MMYHFMFGLRGGSPVAATPSAPGNCSPPTAASFFSSSCMIKLNSGCRSIARLGALLGLLEIAIQSADSFGDHSVNDVKIHSKNGHRDHHHRGGSLHFLPRRRGYLAHLGAH